MTPHQLQLNLQAPLENVAPRRSFKDRVRGGAATWVAVALLIQVVALGLIPALAEAHRLSAAEERLFERENAALAEQSELQLQLRAQNDPIYRERELKLLRAASTPNSVAR